jgi:hypothetical protein
LCVVLDRGPFGFCEKIGGRERVSPQCPRGHKYRIVVRRAGRKGRYRGLLDAAMMVHTMMRSRGWVRATIELLEVKKVRQVVRLPGKNSV